MGDELMRMVCVEMTYQLTVIDANGAQRALEIGECLGEYLEKG